jgi:hypothetical protein
LKSLCEKGQFCLALLVAALWSDPFSKVGKDRLRKAFQLWYSSILTGDRVDNGTAANRLAVCQQCPLWFKPLGTCGSPLRRKDGDLGCWCWMRAKSKLLGAHCWLDEQGIDAPPYGWKQNGL